MKNGKSLIKVFAVVFLTIGTVGLLAAFLLLLNPGFWIASLVLGGTGLPILIAGIICACIYIIPKRRKEKLMEENTFVMAEIADIDWNPNLKYRVDQIMLHPFVIRCRYTDQNGKVYDFKSRPLLYNPSGLMPEQKLKVYVNLQKPGRYVVDTDSILPSNAVLHKFKVIWRAQDLKRTGNCLIAVTCGVELIGQVMVKGSLRPLYQTLADEAAKQFDIPRDNKNRAFMGYTVLCRYDAPDGVSHIFASKGRWGEPERPYIGDRVKVYYEGGRYQRYYVALEEMEEKG